MIASLDHLVLTVADLDATIAFYTGALGMGVETFAGGRKAVTFGSQKINLHLAGHEFEPKSRVPTPGSGDLCFLLAISLEEAEARLKAAGVEIIDGPVARIGAAGPLMSLYLRDPDGNLIEASVLDAPATA